MINKILLSVYLLLVAAMSFGQRELQGSIKGTLRDSTEHQVLKQATISVLRKDTSIISQALSGNDGIFIVNNIPAGNFILKISYSSYETRFSNFTIDSNNTALNAGIIYMQPQAHELAEVVVQTPPIIIKKDTFEFTAGAFATKPNATAEDLLQKLPGVEVDKQGNIKAQGESVQRVLVNGKRFFGDDPRTATQNLPSDVIDKIQVFDDQSDQSAFTGFDDGNRVKTINIITKKNTGSFGKFVAGAGDKGLYNIAANYSMFRDNRQISLIGQLNNTNKQNFTPQDIFGSSGGGGGRSGGSGGSGNRSGGGNFRGGGGAQMQQLQSLNANSNNAGIVTTSAAGINYRDAWGKNTNVYGSYFYNNLLTEKDQKTQTENFVQNDSSIFNNQEQSSSRRNVNQRANLNMETRFDSLNSLIIRPNVSYQQTTNNSATTTSTTKGKSVLLNTADAKADSYNEGYNGNIDMLFRHRFRKKGRTFSLGLTGSGNSNNGDGNNLSVTNYYDKNVDSVYNINQHYTSSSKGRGISTTASYTEPVGKRSQIELNYNYSYNKNTSNKTTYNFDSATQKFSAIDSLLTNDYENTYSSNRVTLNYRFQTDKMNFSIGNGLQFGDLTSINNSKNSEIIQHYTNTYPTANFNYRFSRTSNLRFNYSGRTNQPGVNQLQPVIDNSDPLNVQVGNPNLKQSFTHSFRGLYNSFDNIHFRNIFATVNASFINNNIVTAVRSDTTTGADTMTYVNLNGAYNISAFFNYGFQLKKPKSNLNFTTNFTDSRSVSLINREKNFTTNYTIGETIKFTTNLKKNLDMNFSARPTYNIVRYSLQSSQNDNYFSQNLSVGATYYTASGWLLESDFNYTAYEGRADGYNTAVPLWNAALAKQFFKNKAGELRFSVYDLLNQNVSIVRTVGDTYIQDVQTKVLTRYFMLTFTYNLRNFSKQQQQKQLPAFGPRDGNMPPPRPPGDGRDNGPPPPQPE
ncbi:MAG TPA: outer membrane beta-barrel family protein [Parafilimonas sp.]|nr:outer membrane beta-barrel family protein [Parafilimonas sp.]